MNVLGTTSKFSHDGVLLETRKSALLKVATQVNFTSQEDDSPEIAPAEVNWEAQNS